MNTKKLFKEINESASNISMYVGLICVIYSMLKNNDFSSEPIVTLVIFVSLILFGIFRYISYRQLISEIRNNNEKFISIQIDNWK